MADTERIPLCRENDAMPLGTEYSLAEQITAQIEQYLADAPGAIVIEDGAVIFDFSSAHYSVSPEREKCVLQIWSDERNIVRRVVGSTIKNDSLRLSVMRMGQSKPSILELHADADRRTPSARRVMRAQFQRLMERLIVKTFPGWTLGSFSSAADLEKSFGPAYTRGWVRRGQQYFAVLGVSGAEAQATIDAAVSMAILWLEHCREKFADRGVVEGICVCVPQLRASAVRLRMAHLDRSIAKWRLFEIESRTELMEEIDTNDIGNVATRLVRCPKSDQVLERMKTSIARVSAVVPHVAVVVTSTAEISFRLLGLEFARARVGAKRDFRVQETITFGPGAAEIELTDETEPLFREMASRLLQTRYRRERNHPLFRMAAERWLESIVQRDVTMLDDRLDPTCVYAQVPAFAATDRAVIDLLGVTRQGRLAVIELKADEDLHLPIQGLDYWARVRWHHRRGEFQQYGYFPGRELSPEDPLLILAAPSLHIHPTTDKLLRHLSPEIEWKLVGLDERWRDGVRVVFRKARGH
jgi:hypothetical protein